jgi:hypothetical protein
LFQKAKNIANIASEVDMIATEKTLTNQARETQ